MGLFCLDRFSSWEDLCLLTLSNIQCQIHVFFMAMELYILSFSKILNVEINPCHQYSFLKSEVSLSPCNPDFESSCLYLFKSFNFRPMLPPLTLSFIF